MTAVASSNQSKTTPLVQHLVNGGGSCKYAVLAVLALVVVLTQYKSNAYYSSLRHQQQQNSGSNKSQSKQETSTRPEATTFSAELQSRLVDCLTLLSDKGEPNFVAHTHALRTPFRMSLHSQKFDHTRWGIKTTGRYYEQDLEEIWANILQQQVPTDDTQQPRPVRILDVGANIGYYSLYSAALGNFHIDSFEPNPINVQRLCESKKLNGWMSTPMAQSQPSIDVWQMGVSSKSGELTFHQHVNPGAGTFQDNIKGSLSDDKSLQVPVTTLDDFARHRGWLSPTAHVRIEILKIDVERHEAHVLLGAEALLEANIVSHVFTEVTMDDRPFQEKGLHVLREAGYTLCGLGGALGPGLPVTFPQTDEQEFMNQLFGRLAKIKGKPFYNLWWQIDPACPGAPLHKQ